MLWKARPNVFLSEFATNGFTEWEEVDFLGVILWQGEFSIRWEHFILIFIHYILGSAV